jgi:hypothetical protein
LKYLNQKPRLKCHRGATRKYDGKVDFKKNGISDLSKWVLVGSDEKYPHLTIYTPKLYAVNFDCTFGVVLLLNTKTNKYVLLASTDKKPHRRSD